MAKFLNPYNFIPLSPQVSRSSETEEELFTGKIDYTLTTKSPLFIPNTSNDKAFVYNHTHESGQDDDPKDEHKLFDFFSYETLEPDKTYDHQYFKPIIPGSEMRGAMRSVYEMLTNSCLSVIDDNSAIGKRTSENFGTGVIKREGGKNVLYKAEDTIYREEVGFQKYEKAYETLKQRDGSKIRVQKGERRKGKTLVDSLDGDQVGWLIKGMPGPEMTVKKDEKHNAHILFVKKNQIEKTLNDVDMKSLDTVLKQYQAENSKAYKEYIESYDNFIHGKQEGLPVYYSIAEKTEDRYVMMSPACITREVYKNTIKDILKNHGDYTVCNDKENLCPACQLFGIVNGPLARGSKIRFADLQPECKDEKYVSLYDEIATLDLMGVPYLSNTDFYLKKPVDPDGEEVRFWTYDYYVSVGTDNRPHTKTYVPEISGRKVYWHDHNGIKKCNSKTNLNRTIRPIKSGVTFHGSVYLDDVTKKQLQQIIYILNLGKDLDHAYKIGQGKALGIGSVLLQVDNVQLRKLEKTGRYIISDVTEQPTYEGCGFDDKIKDMFAFVTSINTTKGVEISYPHEKPSDEGYQWFMSNRLTQKQKGGVLENKEDNSPRFRIQTRIVQTQELKSNKLPLLEATLAAEYPVYREPENTLNQDEPDVVAIRRITAALLILSDGGALYFRSIPGAEHDKLNDMFEVGEKIRVSYIGENERGQKQYRYWGKEE